MNEPEQPKKGWGWMSWAVVAGVILMFAILVPALFNSVLNVIYQMRQMHSCKSVTTSLRIFANDFKGHYPDSLVRYSGTANKAFKGLVAEGYADDERIFGGEISPFYADGRIGLGPDFAGAVGPSENHWMMLGGLTVHDNSQHPLIYENAVDSSWPPKWVSNSERRPIRGRTWKGGKILIGVNNGSVYIQPTKLVDGKLTLTSTALLDKSGRPWDDIKVLDTEEKK